VDICEVCHGKVHNHAFLHQSQLIRSGLEQAKLAGKKLGRPPVISARLQTQISNCQKHGLSHRQIAKVLGISKNTVWRATALMKDVDGRPS
jgi:DNA invertase Pin-like site-specific DNA recombinase